MRQKSSLTQDAKSVSQVLMSDTFFTLLLRGELRHREERLRFYAPKVLSDHSWNQTLVSR